MAYKIQTKESLESFTSQNWDQINKFIDALSKGHELPFYASVDIRESKDKLAPVDLNLYPAGLNNLCSRDLDLTSYEIKKFINEQAPHAKTIGIIPESHTKNLFYLDHLAYLSKSIEDAGLQTRFLGLDPQVFGEGETEVSLTSNLGLPLVIEKAEIKQNGLYVQGHPVDLVILNNDQSAPLPVEWESVTTPVHPSPMMGWSSRKKSDFFKFYHDVIKLYASEFSIEPSLLEAHFSVVDHVDFSSKEGLDSLADAVDLIKKKIRPEQKVFVKADQGTYGMGISVVSSGEEVLKMNRKTRNKMDVGKNKIKFHSALVQEGVETILTYDQMPAEVTIYSVGGNSVGGFMRANSLKGPTDNLNSKGMVFKKFCISEIREGQDHNQKEALYSIISRLATLAASKEIAHRHNHKE